MIRYFILIFILFTDCQSRLGLSWMDHNRLLGSLKGKSTPYLIEFVRFSGDPAQIAQQKWVFLDQNRQILQSFKSFADFKKHKPGDPVQTEALLKIHFPAILAELNALADSTGIDRRILIGTAGSRFQIGGCSVYISNSGRPVLARNYDWAPTLAENLVVAYERSSDRLASIGMSEAIVGRLSGINEAGVSIAMAAINADRTYSTGGLSMPIIVRGILDKARNTNEAVALFKKIPHASPYSYAIIDQKGDLAVVEASPDQVIVRRDIKRNNFLSATNHFVKQSNSANKVRIFENSIKRTTAMKNIRNAGLDQNTNSLFSFFGDSQKGPAMHKYSSLFGTLWTVIYEPRKKVMHIRAGTNGQRASLSIKHSKQIKLTAFLQDNPEPLKLKNK